MNHPILLALRYIRLQAIDYFRSYGAGVPDRSRLLEMDPDSRKAVQEVIDQAADGKSLSPFLSKDVFRKWLNATLRKTFRSYTNPTAANELIHAFHVGKLIAAYPQIAPTNQYLFSKSHDPEKLAAALKKYGVNESQFYLPVKQEFPDGKIYHGTRSEDTFRAILLQGVLPSDAERSAGEGFYGVNQRNVKFAEEWGGSRDFVVSLEIRPEARLVDITQGEGKRVWQSFTSKSGTESLESFADTFGVDIIAYPYKTQAYVVKNGTVLERPHGLHREILTLSRAHQLAKEASLPGAVTDLIQSMSLSKFNRDEQIHVLNSIPKDLLTAFLKSPDRIDDVPDGLRLMTAVAGSFEKLRQSNPQGWDSFLERSLNQLASLPHPPADQIDTLLNLTQNDVRFTDARVKLLRSLLLRDEYSMRNPRLPDALYSSPEFRNPSSGLFEAYVRNWGLYEDQYQPQVLARAFGALPPSDPRLKAVLFDFQFESISPLLADARMRRNRLVKVIPELLKSPAYRGTPEGGRLLNHLHQKWDEMVRELRAHNVSNCKDAFLVDLIGELLPLLEDRTWQNDPQILQMTREIPQLLAEGHIGTHGRFFLVPKVEPLYERLTQERPDAFAPSSCKAKFSALAQP